MFPFCLDSAIGNSETVSNNARKNIIAEAKGLIAGGAKEEKAAQTSTRSSRNLEESNAASAAGNSNLREEEELELRSGPLEASRTSNSALVGSPAVKDKKKRAAFVLGDVDANVRAFLDRMRHQARVH